MSERVPLQRRRDALELVLSMYRTETIEFREMHMIADVLLADWPFGRARNEAVCDLVSTMVSRGEPR